MKREIERQIHSAARVNSISEDQMQRAWRAKAEMQRLVPTLTDFANVVAQSFGHHEPLTVKIAAGAPRTDGNTIFMPPLMEMGDIKPHVRSLCSKRGPDSNMLCPACYQLDVVMGHFAHEIAHTVGGSFEKIYDRSKIAQIKQGVHTLDPKRAHRVMQVIEAYIDHCNGPATLPPIAALVNPYLKVLANVLEDARVNQIMFNAREGTKSMFLGKSTRIARDGIEGDDGEWIQWSQLPLNSQAGLALLMVASGYDDLLQYLQSDVMPFINDQRTRDVCRRAVTANHAKFIFGLSVEVMEIGREYGFFLSEDDPEEEQPDEMPSLNKDPEQGEGESGEQNDEQEQSNDDGDGEGETEESDEDAGDGDAGQPEADDESDEESSGSTNADDVDVDDEADDESDAGQSGDESGDDTEQSQSSDDGASATDTDDDAESDGEDEADGAADESVEPDDDASETDGDGEGGEGNDGEMQQTDDMPLSQSAEPNTEHGEFDQDWEGTDHSDDDGSEFDWEEYEDLYGTPEDVEEAFQVFAEHDEDGNVETDETDTDRLATELAVLQGQHFDAPSRHVLQMYEHRRGDPVRSHKATNAWGGYESGQVDDFKPPEHDVNGSLLRLRRVFAENKRAKRTSHRSGRVNASRLASVRTGNKEVFTRASLPGKRDYAVTIALDASGSTGGTPLRVIKQMGMVLGEMMSRLGVQFSITAHEGQPVGYSGRAPVYEMDVWRIKEWNDPWDNSSKENLAQLSSGYNNLDGHAMEFFRKELDRVTATDKVIIYVTDGAMPEANRHEELQVLKRELLTCKKNGYHVIGVGINTDSPRKHGLDTVEVRGTDDIGKVVAKLEEYLT